MKTPLPGRVDRHLAATGAIAAASALCSIAIPPPAEADIYYASGSVTISSSLGPVTSVLFDMDTAGSSFVSYLSGGPAGLAATTGYEFALTLSYGFTVFSYFSYDKAEVTDIDFTSLYVGKYGSFAYKYGAGVTIGPGSTWVSETTSDNRVHSFLYSSKYQSWSSGDSGFIGFKVDKSGSYYYGWIALTYTSPGSQTVTGFAWEGTAGTPILTGAVPEPGAGGLALLALGAAAIGRWRRRRSEPLAA